MFYELRGYLLCCPPTAIDSFDSFHIFELVDFLRTVAIFPAEAALEYGFKDFNGKQPPSLREQKGSPRPFFTKS
jgi:hypothetical protein